MRMLAACRASPEHWIKSLSSFRSQPFVLKALFRDRDDNLPIGTNLGRGRCSGISHAGRCRIAVSSFRSWGLGLGGARMNDGSFRTARKVLIVDDSRSLRAWLRHVLECDPNLHVVGEAADAFEASRMVKALRPDVLTLDVEMPHLDGLQFLSILMDQHPVPVVMFSGATSQGSEAAVRALSLGAVDCLLKPSGVADAKQRRSLARRVFAASLSKVQHPIRVRLAVPPTGTVCNRDDNSPLILIGASTGGVAALETVLSQLDINGPPVVIVQHMPGQFLVSFSRLLNRKLSRDVGLACDGMRLSRGDIRFAPALGQHTEIIRQKGYWLTRMRDGAGRALHCPSVDVLFASAVIHGPDIIAALLTGLGRDGADGMCRLKKAGAYTIGQDKASCVIYGMPRVAKEIGAVTRELPLDRIGQAINRASQARDEILAGRGVRQ